MAKIRENIEKEAIEKIRRQWVEEKGKWYFSIVDVIGLISNSSDARNYWKVLKNRLKNAQKELVTECNQLKMKSNDGKLYLTDVADERTLLEIIKLISPSNLSLFRQYFNELENFKKDSYPHDDNENFISSNVEEENEFLFDGYQSEDFIVIKVMLAGVPAENIFISVTCKNIIIRGERINPTLQPPCVPPCQGEIHLPPLIRGGQEGLREGEVRELSWGKFSRSIILPAEIEIDNVLATLQHGMLTIKLKKINKNLARVIEIKNV
jgi:HSP20 family molecular chaperone IbpA